MNGGLARDPHAAMKNITRRQRYVWQHYLSAWPGHQCPPLLDRIISRAYIRSTTHSVCSPFGVHSGRWSERFHLASRRKAALSFQGNVLRTRICVDGFNLFYGALSGRSRKWLDLYSLFRIMSWTRTPLSIKSSITRRTSRP